MRGEIIPPFLQSADHHYAGLRYLRPQVCCPTRPDPQPHLYEFLTSQACWLCTHPRQYPEKLIPKFIHLLTKGEPLCVHGSGDDKRFYMHTQDLVRAYDAILRSGEIGAVYNIAYPKPLSTVEVARSLLRQFGLHQREGELVRHVEPRPGPMGDSRYRMNCSKLRSLGWEPEVGHEQGLAECVQWHQENPGYWVTSQAPLEAALAPHPHLDARGGFPIRRYRPPSAGSPSL